MKFKKLIYHFTFSQMHIHAFISNYLTTNFYLASWKLRFYSHFAINVLIFLPFWRKLLIIDYCILYFSNLSFCFIIFEFFIFYCLFTLLLICLTLSLAFHLLHHIILIYIQMGKKFLLSFYNRVEIPYHFSHFFSFSIFQPSL